MQMIKNSLIDLYQINTVKAKSSMVRLAAIHVTT